MMTASRDDEESLGVPTGEPMSEAEIDATIDDTFPASDPPSWTLGTDHRDTSTRDEDPVEPDDGPS
jgi:hypothetical protein